MKVLEQHFEAVRILRGQKLWNGCVFVANGTMVKFWQTLNNTMAEEIYLVHVYFWLYDQLLSTCIAVRASERIRAKLYSVYSPWRCLTSFWKRLFLFCEISCLLWESLSGCERLCFSVRGHSHLWEALPLCKSPCQAIWKALPICARPCLSVRAWTSLLVAKSLCKRPGISKR